MCEHFAGTLPTPAARARPAARPLPRRRPRSKLPARLGRSSGPQSASAQPELRRRKLLCKNLVQLYVPQTGSRSRARPRLPHRSAAHAHVGLKTEDPGDDGKVRPRKKHVQLPEERRVEVQIRRHQCAISREKAVMPSQRRRWMTSCRLRETQASCAAATGSHPHFSGTTLRCDRRPPGAAAWCQSSWSRQLSSTTTPAAKRRPRQARRAAASILQRSRAAGLPGDGDGLSYGCTTADSCAIQPDGRQRTGVPRRPIRLVRLFSNEPPMNTSGRNKA